MATDVLYGSQTRLALTNFDVPGPRVRDFPSLVRALATVKLAATRANLVAGALDAQVAGAIEAAAREVVEGEHLASFPLPMLQGGGGTSTNMNMNEVLATRASALLPKLVGTPAVHPNDHVNRSQSTNDVMPTAIAIAVNEEGRATAAALTTVISALLAKAEEYADLVHLGRTCLQDAVPLPVADVHRAQAYAIRVSRDNLLVSLDALLSVPLGGTAVGTGLGTPTGYRGAAIRELAAVTGLPLRSSELPGYGLAFLEPHVHVLDLLSQSARTLARVAADFRILASGPQGGIAELALPAVQAGSSIMPGKTNPVIPELVMQTSFLLAGGATTGHLAAAAGELEVSAMAPVVTLDLLSGLRTLESVGRIFADRCILGLSWNRDQVRRNLNGSLEGAVVRALSDGYDEVTKAVKGDDGRWDEQVAR